MKKISLLSVFLFYTEGSVSGEITTGDRSQRADIAHIFGGLAEEIALDQIEIHLVA